MPAPERVGKYRIVKRLGKGGMGVVYKAVVPELEKVVALKLLAPSEAMQITLDQPELESIFRAEARTMARLQHHGIVSVWDLDRDREGRLFFVMDYFCNNLGEMIGEAFRAEQPSRPLRPEKVLHYGLQLLEALSYLHHARIVHRDIKPHNVLIAADDSIRVCDFGMALVEGVSFSGPENMQIGSPFYAPPEQRRSPHAVDGRADCYSTAVLLYRLLTGTLPGMQSFALSLVNPLYDSSWDAFFRAGLSWDPAARFQTAAAMHAALQRLRVHAPEPRADACPAPGDAVPVSLRSVSENRCGARARDRFNLTDLNRPRRYIANCFIPAEHTVEDRATGLVWQRCASPYPMSLQESDGYIETLNRTSFGTLSGWRLPTVDELLSLLDENEQQLPATIFPGGAKWFWSSDRHGKTEHWYVNLDMGYTAPQDSDCRNHVRAVTGSGPPAAPGGDR